MASLFDVRNLPSLVDRLIIGDSRGFHDDWSLLTWGPSLRYPEEEREDPFRYITGGSDGTGVVIIPIASRRYNLGFYVLSVTDGLGSGWFTAELMIDHAHDD